MESGSSDGSDHVNDEVAENCGCGSCESAHTDESDHSHDHGHGHESGHDHDSGHSHDHGHGHGHGHDHDHGHGHDHESGHSRDHDTDALDTPASPAAGGDDATVKLSVPEMDCPSCAGKVETALGGVAGVSAVETRPTAGTVVVTYDPDGVTLAELTDAVEGAGYPVTGTSGAPGDSTPADDRTGDERASVWRSGRAKVTAVGGVALAAGLVFEFLLPGSNVRVASLLDTTFHAADVLFLAAVAAAGRPIVKNGYYSARTRNLDIDFLMSVAILGALVASIAFGESLYFEAATLAVLFGVAELLERYSMDRARQSLRELLDLAPDQATVKRGEHLETVPVESVAVGDRVVVKPGEKIPTDGEVCEGTSAVDQSPITGESVPVEKTVGDEVYAGTINEGGYLEVTVTARAGEDTLSRVVELVEQAQSDQTEREQFVERFAAAYTPLVVGFAIVTTLGSPFVFGVTWPTAVVYGLTLLVLACPCAFVISTPVSVVSGITSAAKNGVLIEGGRHLEAMGAVDTVAFDKTGTLTKGELTVTDVVGLNGNSRADVLACAQGLERRSEHPIGEAILAAAGGESDRAIDDFESITGKGVRATLDGTPHVVGKPGLFEELGFDLSHVHATTDGGEVTRTVCDRNDCLDLLEDTVPKLQSEGKTVVLVGTEEELEGVIAVADELRPEAAATVRRLRELGVERTVMLTGDNERTARAIAERVGVDEYRAELLPEEKVTGIEELTAGDRTVAMVGDGINDAPALATATVGIAMGAAGTDTALETADVALMSDDLSKLPYLVTLAAKANGVIRQNVWASLAVKAGLAVAVPFGHVPIWLAVLAGDAGMTTAVTANAMRLSRIRPDADGADDSSAAAAN